MVGAGAGVFAAGAVGAPDGGTGAGAAAVGATGGVAGVGGAGGAGGLGAPATGGVGGLTGADGGGVAGKVADGTAGGESAALRVTRTVSFFRGTLDVCLEGVLLSFSLMRSGFIATERVSPATPLLSNPLLQNLQMFLENR